MTQESPSASIFCVPPPLLEGSVSAYLCSRWRISAHWAKRFDRQEQKSSKVSRQKGRWQRACKTDHHNYEACKVDKHPLLAWEREERSKKSSTGRDYISGKIWPLWILKTGREHMWLVGLFSCTATQYFSIQPYCVQKSSTYLIYNYMQWPSYAAASIRQSFTFMHWKWLTIATVSASLSRSQESPTGYSCMCHYCPLAIETWTIPGLCNLNC